MGSSQEEWVGNRFLCVKGGRPQSMSLHEVKVSNSKVRDWGWEGKKKDLLLCCEQGIGWNKARS